jgi:hypothetical protein
MAAIKDNSRARYNACKLTPDQVLMILTRKDMTLRQLAEMLDVSFSTVQKVWQGKAHRHVHPDIPRRPRSERTHASQCALGPRCNRCVHLLNDECSLDLPEYRTQGITAATLCNAYATGRVL